MFFSINRYLLRIFTSEGLDITEVLVYFGFDRFHFRLRHYHVEEHVAVGGLKHRLILWLHLPHLSLQILQGWPGQVNSLRDVLVPLHGRRLFAYLLHH